MWGSFTKRWRHWKLGPVAAFYDSTAGNGWKKSRGWGGSVALGECFGVSTNSHGGVVALTLDNNGLRGS